MENKLSIAQEESLGELVCQYTVILDKSDKGYKEKDVEEITSALDFFYRLLSPAKHHFSLKIS